MIAQVQIDFNKKPCLFRGRVRRRENEKS